MRPSNRLLLIAFVLLITACKSTTASRRIATPVSTPTTILSLGTPSSPTAPAATDLTPKPEAQITDFAAKTSVKRTLDPPPQDCPPGPRPQDVASEYFGPGVGDSPVWAIGFGGPQATLSITLDEQWDQYGWQRKVLWIVESIYMGTISIYGGSLTDNSPIWFKYEAQGYELSTQLLLDTHNPNAGREHKGWVWFGGYLIIPKSDCYYLEAQWPEGGWRITFAAGLYTPSSQ